MEVNVLHMAPRGLYLLFDLAGLISSHSNEASSSAFFFFSSPFLLVYIFGNVSGWDNEGVGVGALQAVKLDGHIFRRPLRIYWQVRWRVPPGQRKRRRSQTGKRESRYRQRKISSVNQAWLTASYFWDWWQFSTGGTPASHLHYNVKLPPTPPSSHLHAVFCESLHPSARPELWVRSYQPQPQSAVGLMYAWSSVIKKQHFILY